MIVNWQKKKKREKKKEKKNKLKNLENSTKVRLNKTIKGLV